MRRREFIVALGGAAAWPLAADAQQPAMPLIGFLNSGSPIGRDQLVTAFGQGLRETGYIESRNVAIVYRWAEGHYDRLRPLAADLTRQHVAAIAATGGMVSPLAAKAETTTIPIVGIFDADPVVAGLIPSINHPGGNLTGISLIASVIEAKQLELLHELAPAVSIVALLVNPSNPNAEAISRNLQAAASALGLKLHVLNASNERDIDTLPASLARLRAGALIVATDPFFLDRRNELAVLSTRQALPTILAGASSWSKAG